jgi:hypothetical protein
MLAGDRSATCGHEADDDQGYGHQGKKDPREHAASLPVTREEPAWSVY